jgi:carbon-monoxide dehydrogenase large subunit
VPPTYVGQRVLRVEDRELLVGAARFVDDIDRDGVLHVCFVRSQVASGRVVSVDVDDARASTSVVATLVADDLPEGWVIPLRLAPNPQAVRALQPPLARGVVRYVGEPVAAIVATSRYAAEDAAERVRVEIEPLPIVLDPERAAAHGGPPVHDALPGNVVATRTVASGDIDRAFERADVVVHERFAIQRHTALPLETRGLLAEVDSATGQLSVWGAAKVKHFNRRALAELLDLPLDRVRLVEIAVGGAFGVRGELYPEDVVVPWLALRLERPVKWIEDRREHFVATNHSREQHAEIAVAASSEGDLLGIRARAFVDLGAYVRTNALVLPLNTATHLAGPYRWQAVAVESYGVLTNKTPAATYRGPGMFEPAFHRERALDLLARRLQLDPADLRRRNLIPRELLPHTLDVGNDLEPIVYGAGDFAHVWETLCTRGGYMQLRQRVTERRERGEVVGIGTAAFIEAGARGPYEWARVVPERDGSFTIHLGLSSVGQGLRTALSQIAADALGVPMARIRVTHASTDEIEESAGTFSSRSTVFGTGAVLGAIRDLSEQAVLAAADRFAVERENVELLPGAVARVGGADDAELTFAELEVEGFHRFEKQGRTFSMGGALIAVSIDPATGAAVVERGLVAWDVGRAINPLVVEGQLVGAAAQGIGGALFEELAYDDSGQPLVTSFLDYPMVTAGELPPLEAAILELGEAGGSAASLPVKGAGEAGIIGIGAAVANAIADATGGSVPDLQRLPLKPESVWAALRVRGAQAGAISRSSGWGKPS